MTYVMIDLETLGTKPGCKVLSIGACVFGPGGVVATFYRGIILKTSPGDIEPDTLQWWMLQKDDARIPAFSGNTGHETAMLSFISWWGGVDATSIWGDPVHFDVPLLEASMRAAGITEPWTHRDVRDARTVRKIAGVEIDRSKGIAHHALDDAIAQAEATIKALNIIGWPKE